MRKSLLIFILLLVTEFCYAGPVDSIEHFYVAYIRCMIDNKSEDIISLKKLYLTPECQEKLDRIKSVTNCDPILRAQDVNTDMLESLYVQDVGKDWYIVSYYWDRTKRTSLVKIPLKAYTLNEQLIISYITPEWNHDAIGDNTIRQIEIGNITYDSGVDFVKSFYNQYLSIYCTMGVNVYESLDRYRRQFFTDNAVNDFKNKEADYTSDGEMYYDLLIDNFDFDVSWYDSLTITQTGDAYNVTYYDGKMHSIDVYIKKIGKHYCIEHVSQNPIKEFNPLYLKSNHHSVRKGGE